MTKRLKRKSKSPKPSWPERFPNDPLPVRLLVEEAERLTDLVYKWRTRDRHHNPIADNNTFQLSVSISYAAAWLRTKLKGELVPEREKNLVWRLVDKDHPNQTDDD